MNTWILGPYGLLLILVWHWVADFVAQTDKNAKNKWTSNEDLLEHITGYTLMWLLPICIIWAFPDVSSLIFLFIPITFLCHMTTDYFTSKAVHMAFEKGDTHTAFVIIGFDQILHYIQLYLTFKLLI